MATHRSQGITNTLPCGTGHTFSNTTHTGLSLRSSCAKRSLRQVPCSPRRSLPSLSLPVHAQQPPEHASHRGGGSSATLPSPREKLAIVSRRAAPVPCLLCGRAGLSPWTGGGPIHMQATRLIVSIAWAGPPPPARRPHETPLPTCRPFRRKGGQAQWAVRLPGRGPPPRARLGREPRGRQGDTEARDSEESDSETGPHRQNRGPRAAPRSASAATPHAAAAAAAA